MLRSRRRGEAVSGGGAVGSKGLALELEADAPDGLQELPFEGAVDLGHVPVVRALASRLGQRDLQQPREPHRQSRGARDTRGRPSGEPPLLSNAKLVEDHPVARLELGDGGIDRSLLSVAS
jgi:hypothetical protein